MIYGTPSYISRKINLTRISLKFVLILYIDSCIIKGIHKLYADKQYNINQALKIEGKIEINEFQS